MRPVDIARQILTRRRSARTELHWLPRVNDDHAAAHQHWATADRSLGERDWAAIDPIQVRTSRGVRHYFTGALYFWQRSRSHVWCESQEERWEVLWLDYGGQVDRLWAQPMAIAFGHGSRLSGLWHVPDLLAQFTDGSYGLLDVRPAELVDESARQQFEETAKVCGALGWHYRVLTGHDPLATRLGRQAAGLSRLRRRPRGPLPRHLAHHPDRGQDVAALDPRHGDSRHRTFGPRRR